MTPREELIEIQKRLVKKIKQEIYADYCRENPEIETYYEAYKKETDHFERTATKAELLQQIFQSQIVYVGDYHTFRQSQKTLLRLLDTLHKDTAFLNQSRPIILCLEMIHHKDQTSLEQYLRKDIDEKSFLKTIRYETIWGFPWIAYKEILDYARKHSIKVIGLNTEYTGQAHSLKKRDQYAAEIITKTFKTNQNALLLVLFGDLHLAEEHLPGAVNQTIKKAKLPSQKSLIIYQNSERIYWELARQGQEQEIDVVRIKDRTYCVINSTPLFVFQSHLNWQKQEEEIHSEALHKNWCAAPTKSGLTAEDISEVSETELTTQVIDIVKSICQFLELEPPSFDKLSVYTPHNFDIMKRLGKDVLSRQEIKEIEIDLEQTESYFIDQTNMVYLSNLSINHVAEESAHFIHNHYAPKAAFNPDFTRLDRFYYHIIREALGYIGSKIINHKRMCRKASDFDDKLVESFAEPDLNPTKKEEYEIAKLIVHHKHQEKNYLLTKQWKPIRQIYYLSAEQWISICQALGYMLGDKIHEALMQNIISKSEIRELFLNSFSDKGQPFKSYLYLTRRIETAQELYPRITDHL